MVVVLGISSGFVTVAPVDDPAGTVSVVDTSAYVTKDTSPATAIKITEIGWWCNEATEAANFELGLYAADGAVVPGEAGTLLEVERTNAKGTTSGWKRVTVDWEIDPSTDYWLGVQLDNTLTDTRIGYNSSGALGRDYRLSQTTLPDPFNGGAIYDPDGMYAVYAVWEAAVGTNMKVNIADVFKDISEIKINIGDVWKTVTKIQINIGNVWKTVFG